MKDLVLQSYANSRPHKMRCLSRVEARRRSNQMKFTGTVHSLELRRSYGKVVIRNFALVEVPQASGTGGGGGPLKPGGYTVVKEAMDHYFLLYNDGDVSMIDPTEMVRRNWMIGLLERALTEKLQASIIAESEAQGIVQGVELLAAE